MRAFIFHPLLALLLVVSSQGCAPKIQKVEDLADIKAMFLQFRAALQQQAGDEAVAYVSENTVGRYQQFQNWAVNTTSEELQQLSVVEQIEVQRLQRNFTAEQLKSMTPSEVLAGLIDHNHLGAPFVADATLAEPVFQKNKCYFQIFDQAGAVKEKLTFVKEDSGWKIDLAALEDIHKKVYSGMMRKRDLTPEELVQTITEGWESAGNSHGSDHSEDEEN